jgi:uridine monophosphate synthetase
MNASSRSLMPHLRRPMNSRKEKKEYGTGAMIESLFNPGLLVDDVITRGDSKLEAMKPLHDAGLIIIDIAVLLDRQSGGT